MPRCAGLVIFRYARRRGLALALDPLDLTADRDRLLELGYGQSEDEDRPDLERLLRSNERAALTDVLRIVGEEGIELLVLDL